jgi:peptidoglycan hydrolase CwlO-like protein
MKTGKIETITLGLGGAIIVVALVLFLFFRNNLAAGVWINVLMAVGFALYIVYNVISSSNNNQTIETLREQVVGLEQEKESLQNEVAAKSKEVSKLHKEVSGFKNQVDGLEAQLRQQAEKIISLEATSAANTGAQS